MEKQPSEAVLGGTFYFEEITILNGSMAYARAGDGHIGCDILLGYKIENGDIKWEVIAYDENETGYKVK